MQHVRHPSLKGNGGVFNPAFAELRDRRNGSNPAVRKFLAEARMLQFGPAAPPPTSAQPELPLDLPPRPVAKPRRRWGSVAPRVEAIAVLCGRSIPWARQVEKRLAEEGIDGRDLIRLALIARDLLRVQPRHNRDRELVQAFSRAPRAVREQLVALID